MTLQEFAWIGGVIGAIAMVVSVLFASVQIRNNTRAIRAAAFQQVVASRVGQLDALASDPNLCSLVLRGGDDFAGLDRVEKARCRFHLQAFIRRGENVWMQNKFGTLHDANVAGIRDSTERIFSSPGQRAAWALIRTATDPVFRAYIDEIVRQEAEKAAISPTLVAETLPART